jgi:intracellular sulfur oxidation DsrE/DsrF family protein
VGGAAAHRRGFGAAGCRPASPAAVAKPPAASSDRLDERRLPLIKNDIADWNAKSEVIAVFHMNAGHVTLHDIAYNADRNIATGNPYKDLIGDLQKRGVEIELCGATAKAHHWGNADLLPGIKVNTDAMARTTPLVQQGFVKITE